MGSPWIVAHIVGMRPAGLLSWLAAIALFGGVLGIFIVAGQLRHLWAVVAIMGLAGTVYDMVERSQPPARPNLIVRLVSPNSKAEDPLVVRLCSSNRQGRPAQPVAGGRHLLVRLDGVQVAEVHESTVMLPVTLGWHLLDVEITSPLHQQYQPPIVVRRLVHVVPGGVSVALRRCGDT